MRALVVAAILLGGCYNPDAQSGAYLCGEDGACPDGLQCVCGQCVKEDAEAACSFSIDSPMATTSNKGRESLLVSEHEIFPITVQALATNGSPATGFHGNVSISSTWGDVCVGTGGCATLPNQVELSGGTASAMIQLNRETIPPATAILRATLGSNGGTSGKLQITVSAPAITADASPIVAPLGGATSYGFSSTWIGGPSVVKSSDGWRMFYEGNVKKSLGHVGIGVASSTDGVTFDPPATPIFDNDETTDGNEIGTPAAFDDGKTTHVYVGHKAYVATIMTVLGQVMKKVGYQEIAEITGPSAGSSFDTQLSTIVDVTGSTPDCPFCNAVDTPLVIKDPNPDLDGTSTSGTLMFFTALQDVASGMPTAALVRATGDVRPPDTDLSFDVDPAPILASTTNENVIYSPRVFVDGTIYKMYYAFTAIGVDGTTIDPCAAKYHIGYATSADGHFWTRSTANVTRSMGMTTYGHDFTASWASAATALLVGAVMPADGVDPSKGVALYFSPLARLGLSCVPNGIGRASAP